MSSYVVTGAARGIGFEFIKQLSADQKNTVFALVRNEATATELKKLPGKNITVLEADITDTKALKKAADAVSKTTGGKLDYLINNAALINFESTISTLLRLSLTRGFSETEEALEMDLIDHFKVNTIGTIHCTNTFLPLLRKGTVKKVITISSGQGDVDAVLEMGIEESPGYAISKAAINLAIAKYAVELRPEGFVFLSLSPGAVNTIATPLTAEVKEAFAKMMGKFTRVVPHFKGPISPEESVKLQLEVIYKWKVEDTGAFVSQHGTKQWL
ncbi:hypothetical protein C8R43DRAFT_1197777 [Mycena crocata]|nr:hypothetical protein C8R43DRAFT_1197777 [Mycena crocata]